MLKYLLGEYMDIDRTGIHIGRGNLGIGQAGAPRKAAASAPTRKYAAYGTGIGMRRSLRRGYDIRRRRFFGVVAGVYTESRGKLSDFFPEPFYLWRDIFVGGIYFGIFRAGRMGSVDRSAVLRNGYRFKSCRFGGGGVRVASAAIGSDNCGACSFRGRRFGRYVRAAASYSRRKKRELFDVGIRR